MNFFKKPKILSFKITQKYSIDLSFLLFIRNFKDGISFLNFDIDLNLFEGDHNPSFNVMLLILNLVIFEVNSGNKDDLNKILEKLLNEH